MPKKSKTQNRERERWIAPNKKKDKLQITPLQFGCNWILYSEISEFEFYPVMFGDVWILHSGEFFKFLSILELQVKKWYNKFTSMHEFFKFLSILELQVEKWYNRFKNIRELSKFLGILELQVYEGQ